MSKHIYNKNAAKTGEAKITFNVEDYVEYLDGMDLTDAEARELLSVLWDMMVQFVDLGFQIHTDTRVRPKQIQSRALGSESLPSAAENNNEAEGQRP